jgi:hypothetical protein
MRAARLWNGRFVTSYVTVLGDIFDFGSLRSVPTWKKRHGNAGEVFACEIDGLRRGYLSVLFYCVRYSKQESVAYNPQQFLADLPEIIDDAFKRKCIQLLGLASHPAAAKIAEAVLQYQRFEQKFVTGDDVADTSFAYRALDAASVWRDWEASQQNAASQLLNTVFATCGNVDIDLEKRLKAFFHPLHHLRYHDLDEAIAETIRAPTGKRGAEIGDLIDRIYALSVRRPSWLNDSWNLDFIASNSSSAVVFYTDARDGAKGVFIRAMAADGTMRVLNKDCATPRIGVEDGGYMTICASVEQGRTPEAVVRDLLEIDLF